MPRLEDNDENNDNDQSVLQTAGTRLSNAWDGFIDFLFSDNVLEVAVGFIIASAFSAVVKGFVSDVLLPIVSLVPGLERNFDDLFAVLKMGESGGNGNGNGKGGRGGGRRGYNTIQQANDDGALVLAYGSFIDKILNFLILGLALYVIAQTYQSCSGDKVIKRTVKCRYCRKRISDKAKRCFNCTSWQDGRED